jgi:hypothetical protein
MVEELFPDGTQKVFPDQGVFNPVISGIRLFLFQLP